MIELIADSAVNYAVQQNAVTIIKRLRITNTMSDDLEQVLVSITTEPQFAHPWEYRLERMAAGSAIDLGAVDLILSHDFLAAQTEAVRGAITVTVRREGEVLAEHRAPIDVLAYDQWNGLRSVPEMLAAFVMPNHPTVERLLKQAAGILKGWTGNPSFDGYQQKSPERVRMQAAAIYAAIQSLGITYNGLAASFEQQGQKIRTPDRVLEHGLANCLDLSTLLAACFEQAGLKALICLVEGDAFPAVWTVDESFADAVVDDALVIRKRIDLGEILVLESTLAVDGSTADFAAAMKAGQRHFDDPSRFLCAVDIWRSRLGGILPLPARRGVVPLEILEADLIRSASSPILPPIDLPPPGAAASTGPSGPITRLDRWKRKLLDLSLRNRLLNFVETKNSVPLLFPDLPALGGALAEGRLFEMHPRPQDWQNSERNLEVHQRRTGEDAEEQLLLGEFAHRRLRAGLEPAELTRRLTDIFRAARTAIEENGANTLYLALGMLVWYETKSATQPRRAPILLIPVELQRRSAQSGFTVRRNDDEAMINVTLLELLRNDFNLQIDGLDPLPEDDSGIDVRQVLDRVRQAVKSIERWDVVEDAYIGLFSFTKFLMWRDLEVRTEELSRNKLVSSLIHFPKQPFPAATDFPDPARLDDEYLPDQTFCPVSTDSSQLAAVYAAGEGKSFVLHGPPGTGKSQTITNIIAQALAQGKTVLFVAEKMAALSVVQRRLEQVGLDDFCLELHSNKSKKADVLAQLDRSLRLANLKGPDEWQTQAQRLAQTRRELNGYVQALHRTRHTGESFYTGISKLVALGDGPRVSFEPAFLNAVSGADLERLRDKVRALSAAGGAAGAPASHLWRAVRQSEWTPQWRDQVDAAITRLRDAIHAAADAVKPMASLFGLPDGGWSWNELVALRKLGELIQARTTFAPALVAASDWEEAQASVERWMKHGSERDRLRGLVHAKYTDRVLSLDLDGLANQAALAAHGWFLPKWLKRRAIIKTLQGVAKPGQKIDAASLERDIDLARQLAAQERAIRQASDQARGLLGRLWQDGEADWADIGRASEWAGSIRRLAAQIGRDDALRTVELRRRWAVVMTEQAESLRAGGAYAPALQRLIDALGALEASRVHLVGLLALDEAACWGDSYVADHCGRVAEVLDRWASQTGQLRLWCAWVKERDEAVGLQLGALVAAYEEGQITSDEIPEVFERSFYRGWVDQIIGQEEPLRRFSRQSMEERLARFRELDDRFSLLTRQEIQARLSARIPRFNGEVSQNSAVGILRREIQKRSRHMALRALFDKTRDLLPRLKPCLLMSPISVAQYLDPKFPPFDLIIFDEASQVPTWDAVGAIARGAETIIVGDPKQLPPTNFFARADNPDDEEVGTEDLESILDDSLALTMPELHLRWHYRSQHESLIAFSNYHYYESGLVSFPSPVDGSAMGLRYVKGEYDRGRSKTNRVEAEAIVQEVVRRLTDPALAKHSIGIVAFSVVQQRLIEDLMDDARRRHPEIEPHFSGDDPVFIKNLENVQGDERDVILFSVCYGPDASGKVTANFGPLNREGGERRLNVAITRARREVLVFTSLLPEQIDLTRTKAVGVHHLRSFLEFAQRGIAALKEQVHFGGREEQTALEQRIYEALTEKGYRVQRKVGSSEYRIDLAVEDPNQPGRFILGIECDGPTYYSAKTARDRDKLRAAVLAGLGWRLHRVWAPDWLEDPAGELERIEAAIAAGSSPVVEQVASAVEEVFQSPVPVVVEEVVEAPALPVYRVSEARPPAVVVGFDFFSLEAGPHIQKLIADVVADEGPISLSLLCQRVAPWWGISRMTARVEERVRSLTRGLRVVDGFVWPPRVEPEAYREFRVPSGDEGSRRDAADLPVEEIANAALHVLQGQVSLPVDDLVREVARLFGYQRIGPNVDRCLRAGIGLLVSTDRAGEQEGVVVVRDR